MVQRVTRASVTVGGEVVGEIGPGMLVLVCAIAGDGDDAAARLADRLCKLRIFRDEAGRMNRSLLDAGGSALVVSQFTLAADTSRGNRPGFSAAAPPAEGQRLYDLFAREMATRVPTATGRFGADMAVALVNDGPVTISLEA